MDDTISRQAAIDALDGEIEVTGKSNAKAVLKYTKMVSDRINGLPPAQPEAKKGHWTEKEVMYIKDTKDAIDAWQSCRCSECKRYDTRPYMYYFSEPRFCSYCGAEMEGVKMPSELRCKNCTCSDYYNNNLVCWLYSDDEIYYLEEESEACPDYDERGDNAEISN